MAAEFGWVPCIWRALSRHHQTQAYSTTSIATGRREHRPHSASPAAQPLALYPSQLDTSAGASPSSFLFLLPPIAASRPSALSISAYPNPPAPAFPIPPSHHSRILHHSHPSHSPVTSTLPVTTIDLSALTTICATYYNNLIDNHH